MLNPLTTETFVYKMTHAQISGYIFIRPIQVCTVVKGLKTIDRKSFECGNFLVLHPALLKIAYFNSCNRQLSIAVLPKSCDKEKLSIPLEPHHKAQSSKNLLFSGKQIKRAVLFYLLGNPAETPYLMIRDG